MFSQVGFNSMLLHADDTYARPVFLRTQGPGLHMYAVYVAYVPINYKCELGKELLNSYTAVCPKEHRTFRLPVSACQNVRIQKALLLFSIFP